MMNKQLSTIYSEKRTVRFGIVGLGSISRLHAKAITGLVGAEFTAVVSENKEKCDWYEREYGCKTYGSLSDFLLDDEIDVVCVCLPSSMHVDAGMEIAKAGKHVVMEKPMDISSEKAATLIQYCNKQELLCSVVFQHRFDEGITHIKKAIKSGMLGKLYYGACHTKWYRNHEYYNNSWKGTLLYDGGGALINQAVHYVDLLLYLMGDIEEVFGICRTMKHEIEAEDLGIASVKFCNGAVGFIEGSTLTYPGLHAKLELYGEHGTVIIKDDRIEYLYIDGEDEMGWMENNDATQTGSSVPDQIDCDSHRKYFADVADAIRFKKAPLISGKEGIRSLRVIEAIYKSSKLNCPILVNNGFDYPVKAVDGQQSDGR